MASRRDRRSVRERDRERTADNREAVYVRPLGNGYHLVKNQDNDTLYKVSANADATFSPGSKVLLGSHSGHPGEVVIGGPPADKKGASKVAVAPTVRTFNAAQPVPRYYGLDANGDSDLILTLHSITGAWLQDVGGVYSGGFSDSPTGANGVCIVSDPSGKVANGSIAWKRASAGALTVWDARTDTSYDYLASGSKLVTVPIYLSGALYWWEFPAHGTATGGTPVGVATVTLMTSLCDFTGVVTVASVAIHPWVDTGASLGLHASNVALTTSSSLIRFVGSGLTEGDTLVTQPLAGAATVTEPASTHDGMTLGIPDALGRAIGALPPVGSDPVMRAIAANATAWASSAAWPITDSWAIAGTAGNAGVTADLGTATLYGDATGDSVWTVVEAPITGGAAPTLRTQLGNTPRGGPPFMAFPIA